ncbi:MAG: peptidoglycan-binding protein [Alkalinema sp. RU_4_3]|nr:peptidoglycan-binding protein [Alkalinema sp. RU_4_3]
MSNSIHHMQRYILGGIGLIAAMGITLPIAMARVSQTAKFPGQSVKSEDCAGQPQKEAKVVVWAKDCAPLKVEPKKAEAKPAIAERPPEKAVEKAPEKTAEKTPDQVADLEVLRSGMTGDEIAALQEHLQKAGASDLQIDGVFGQDTEIAVRLMQERLKLEPTGVADAAFQGRSMK